jgi:blue light- and temperature-responsive anti-repressor
MDYRLVYHSLNRLVRAPDAMRAEIDGILEKSRHNNDKVGVTGALMFNAGIFAQVLEGSQSAIEATFERIQRDPRHGEVTLLEFVPIEARTFSNWSMAYIGQADTGLGDLAETSGFDPLKLDGNGLFEALRDLLQRDMPRAA